MLNDVKKKLQFLGENIKEEKQKSLVKRIGERYNKAIVDYYTQYK